MVYRSLPFLSIITVSYNAALSIEYTINSVLNQKDKSIEYWIIDGNSRDGTLEIIKRYEDRITGWISEPDNGIYDAMNKGLFKAEGEWILFLGADDTLMPNAINILKSHSRANVSLVFGKVVLSNGRVVESFLNQRTIFQNTLHHQGVIYNRKLFSNFQYDSSLKIISDYELNLILYLKKAKYLKIDNVIATCSENGASSNVSLSIYETNLIRSRHVSSKLLNNLLSSLLSLYYFQKKVRAKLTGKKEY